MEHNYVYTTIREILHKKTNYQFRQQGSESKDVLTDSIIYKFIIYCGQPNREQEFAKEILFGKWDGAIANFLLSYQNELNHPAYVTGLVYQTGSVKITFSVGVCMDRFERDDNHNIKTGSGYLSFFITDLTAYTNCFIEINEIISLEKSKGVEELSKFRNLLVATPIVLQAGYLFAGDYEAAQDGDTEALQLPETLAEVYKKVGFIDCNKYIGNYEESICMIHPNLYGEWLKVPEFLEKDQVLKLKDCDAFDVE